MNICQQVSPTHAMILALSGALGLVGCGDSDTPTPTEQVGNAIVDLEDASYDQEAFSSLFTDGNAPGNRGDYARVDVEVTGEPTVNGQTAKVPVTLTPRTGLVLGEGMPPATAALPKSPVKTTWTLEETGEGWKIADAPLK